MPSLTGEGSRRELASTVSSTVSYSFEDIAAAFTRKASNYIGHRYRIWGIEPADVGQEIYLWLYGKGASKVRKWLDNEPQQTTRIYRSMLDVGITYAEREKATKVGYHVDDVYWYTPSAVEGLMPLVLDPTFTQENEHVGELITMVIDIRRVMKPDDFEWFTENDSEHVDYAERVRVIIDRLGGDRPHVGRRKVMTNATAQAITSEQA